MAAFDDLQRILLDLEPLELIRVIGPAVEKLDLTQFARLTEMTQPLAFTYQGIGRLIDIENPYFEIGDATISQDDIDNFKVGGQFSDRRPAADNLYNLATHGAIPDPGVGSATWYFNRNRVPKLLNNGTPGGAGNPAGTRRVVKSVEIEYGTPVDGGGGVGAQRPHIIILFSGADSGGG